MEYQKNDHISTLQQALLPIQHKRFPSSKVGKILGRKIRQYVQFGIDKDGVCALQYYKDAHSQIPSGQYRFTGKNIEIVDVEPNSMPVSLGLFCIQIKGMDFKRNDLSQAVSLYIYTKTELDTLLCKKAITALSCNSSSSGLCIHKNVLPTLKQSAPEGTYATVPSNNNDSLIQKLDCETPKHQPLTPSDSGSDNKKTDDMFIETTLKTSLSKAELDFEIAEDSPIKNNINSAVLHQAQDDNTVKKSCSEKSLKTNLQENEQSYSSPAYKWMLGESAHHRIKELKTLLQLYEHRLSNDPNGFNAHLWKQEIHEVRKELELIDKVDFQKDMKVELDMMRRVERQVKLRNEIMKIWKLSKTQDPDSLFQSRSSKHEYDPQLLLEKSSFNLKMLRDELDSILNEADNSEENYFTRVSAQMLRENIELRMQLNRYEDEIIMRTTEKAEQFNRLYQHESADISVSATSSKGAKGNDTTWTSFMWG